MKLNHDCVRELLLYLENNLQIDDVIDVREISLKKFTQEEIRYSAIKLSEIEYINATTMIADAETEVFISSITWEGHKFLDTVRDNVVWTKTKGFLSKFASASLSFTADVASQVIANMLSQYMQLPPPQHQP